MKNLDGPFKMFIDIWLFMPQPLYFPWRLIFPRSWVHRAWLNVEHAIITFYGSPKSSKTSLSPKPPTGLPVTSAQILTKSERRIELSAERNMSPPSPPRVTDHWTLSTAMIVIVRWGRHPASSRRKPSLSVDPLQTSWFGRGCFIASRFQRIKVLLRNMYFHWAIDTTYYLK